MLAIMCEKPPPATKRSDLPEVPGPTLRPRNILRQPRPLGTIRHSEVTHLSRSVFNSHRAVPGSPSAHVKGKEITSPRVDAKTSIMSNSNKQRKILSASFPKALDTVPVRSKVTLVKSSTSSDWIPGPQHRSSEIGVNRHRTTPAWTRHVHHKYKTTRPFVNAPVGKEGGNERNSPKEFDDVGSRNYEPESDQCAQNGNMGYREKCLHWLLTLPD